MATASASPVAVQVKRTFAAPREKVFEAWINPKMMTKWFPRGATDMPPTEIVECDPRPGGRYRVNVVCPVDSELREKRVYNMQGTYQEVKPPERLVFTWWWPEADFQPTLVTVDFRVLGESNFTEVTLTHERLPEKEREEHRQGWIGCFAMLEKALKGEL